MPNQLVGHRETYRYSLRGNPESRPANSTCELGNADPEVLAHAHQTYEASTALIGDRVARAQREGDLPAEADPIALARALLAAQQGIVFMGRTGEPNEVQLLVMVQDEDFYQE